MNIKEITINRGDDLKEIEKKLDLQYPVSISYIDDKGQHRPAWGIGSWLYESRRYIFEDPEDRALHMICQEFYYSVKSMTYVFRELTVEEYVDHVIKSGGKRGNRPATREEITEYYNDVIVKNRGIYKQYVADM